MKSLDEYLKKLEEKNKAPEQTYTIHIDSLDDDMEIRTLTHSEKKDLIYSEKIKKETIGDMLTPVMIKTIYNCMNLNALAVAAKEKGLIKSYYDIVEHLFEPDDLAEIILKIYEINGLSKPNALQKAENDGIDEVKN